jgi:membrane associated rhomboid family serine protease
MHETQKEKVLNGILFASIAVFAVSSRISSSLTFSIQTRSQVRRFLTFSKHTHPISAFTYIFNHANPKHLAFNTLLLWSFGNQLVNNPEVKLPHFLSLTACGALATALSERPWLADTRPLVGASGVVMAYLASIATVDPEKSWIMILPIPGVPVTSLQLLQGCFVTHIGLLISKRFTRVALRGHLGGMAAGYAYSKVFLPNSDVGIYETSVNHWKRSIVSAEIAAYWIFLSVRLILPDPFLGEAERGLLVTKRRFMERVWREEY